MMMETAIRLQRNGQMTKDIATRLGVHTYALYSQLKFYNDKVHVPVKKKPGPITRLTPQEVQRITKIARRLPHPCVKDVREADPRHRKWSNDFYRRALRMGNYRYKGVLSV